MGRGGTARPREAEWNSGVAAFLGGVKTNIFYKDPFGHHYHDVSVLYNKDIPEYGMAVLLTHLQLETHSWRQNYLELV